MAGKRKANDENSGSFINMSGPPQKRVRLVTQPVTEALMMEARKQWEGKQREEAAAKADFLAQRAREEEAERRAASALRIGQVLDAVKAAGYRTLHEFLGELLATKDQHQSSQVSQTLINHGDELLDLIRARQPQIVSQWISRAAGEILKEEGAKLAQLLRPPQGQGVSTTLENFSLERILADAEYLAPTLCILLRSLAREEADKDSGKEKRRDVDLVLSTVICMLVQKRNEKSSEYQTTMSFYLLACGATRSQFEVLNHAGICLSYRSTLQKVKDLGQERLAAVRKIAHERMFMLIWDNPNFAFRVGQQRLGSNDHFDNGTTATLIVLWGFVIGDLPLEMLPPRKTRLPVLEFTAKDLLPSLEDVQQLEALHRWHIEDILVQAYPILLVRFSDSISEPPSILLIPVHTTEQCTLPAMQIDESSLDGTIDVFSTIFRTSLRMTEEDIKRHGVVICAGDQLSASLFDKICSTTLGGTATKRDPIYENISLFNCDALTLLALRAAVKRGDVGRVLCVSVHWMVMFRGTGRMPKYADAIFRVLTELKSMPPKLREAYLMNWLANLSGKLFGFKEMDLLQEHQNFWLKVIYNARGSNRSWEWLGMISVSIFALRDVIRRVQLDYKIPHNGKSHSNPSTVDNICAIRTYLELHKLQSFCPERADNDLVLPARDLMETGAAYANTARAFKTFRADNRKAKNLGTDHGSAAPAEEDDDELANPDNYEQDLGLDLGDLALDEEEFPAGIDPSDFVAMATEAIIAMEENEF
ncbi:hypothetical protein B0H13DRAFT_2353767 [Mycena leptocephala]|nr:hypothetical protein B0H13DRAFT_2353767 [Mycena leptocephala]